MDWISSVDMREMKKKLIQERQIERFSVMFVYREIERGERDRGRQINSERQRERQRET